MIIESLYTISLVLTPTERWKLASDPFKTIYSVDGLSIVILILSVILICWIRARHSRSEHRLKQKIAELTATNEKLQQEITKLKPKSI